MYKEQLAKYVTSVTAEFLVDTKNNYEFTMVGIFAAGDWYALVEDPDLSRIKDIDKVIDDEFQSKILGWCVLKANQKNLGTNLLPFDRGEAHWNDITLQDGTYFAWLLKIHPRTGGRLKRLSGKNEK